jgi:hypothetical protein
MVNYTPTAVMIRRILGSVSQFEKAMLVAKLKGARERKKALTRNAAVGSPTSSETRLWSRAQGRGRVRGAGLRLGHRAAAFAGCDLEDDTVLLRSYLPGTVRGPKSQSPTRVSLSGSA